MNIVKCYPTMLFDRWSCNDGIDGIIAGGLLGKGGVGVDTRVLEGSGGGGLSAYLEDDIGSLGLA